MRTERFDDTWEWDGTDWTQVADIGPPARVNHALALTVERQRVVLLCGLVGTSLAQDTWEWDGDEWTQVADAGPPPRAEHALAFDSQRQRTVLFGGQASDAQLMSDTWERDGEGWTQQEDTGPTPRKNHAMAFDSQQHRVVLFGGQSGPAGLGDTWEWDGSTWTERATFGPDPSLSSAMASLGAGVVLFGGVSSVDPSANPVVVGKRWTQRQDIGPHPRWRHAITFDSKRGRVVLFGGLPVFAPQDPTLPDQLLGDTWEHVDDTNVGAIESLLLVPPTVSRGDSVTATITLAQPAPQGRISVTVDVLGQPISDALPTTISISQGAKTAQVSFGIRPVVVQPGLHTIVATTAADTKTAVLTIN